MFAWMKKARSTGSVVDRAPARAPAVLSYFSVPAEYRPLHKYLDERYAHTVVLTFAEIEDLLGFALPAVARIELGWWKDAAADGTKSAQASSWIQASRTAHANIIGRTVSFARTSGG